MNVGEALSRKYGPLPLGAWLIAIVGGVGVAVVIRRQAGNDQLASDAYAAGEQAGYDSVAQDSTGGYTESPSTNQGAGNLYTPDPDPDPPGPIKTNKQWRTRAARVLAAEGYRPALVETALGRYFTRKTLTRVQQEVITEAIARIGPPPHPPKPGGRDATQPPRVTPGNPIPGGPRVTTRDTGHRLSPQRSISNGR